MPLIHVVDLRQLQPLFELDFEEQMVMFQTHHLKIDNTGLLTDARLHYKQIHIIIIIHTREFITVNNLRIWSGIATRPIFNFSKT